VERDLRTFSFLLLPLLPEENEVPNLHMLYQSPSLFGEGLERGVLKKESRQI
jgi:hypothetical protein